MEEKPKTIFPDPEALARAGSLGLMARQTVEGALSGLHRGSFKGYAKEFSGYREYLPGDELRQMDWRATARKGKPLLRQFFSDSDFPVHLAVDGSESMKYASAEISKYDYALNLAACLAYTVLRQEDAAQVSLLGERLRETTPALNRVDGFAGLMEKMAAWKAGGTVRVGESIRELSEKTRPGGLVVLLSDFFEESGNGNGTWAGAVERLRFHGSEVLLIQVMDPEELEFPFDEMLEFKGMEGGESIEADGAEVRAAYLEVMKEFLAGIREFSSRNGSHHLLADTSKPVAGVLQSYLLFRRQSRVV